MLARIGLLLFTLLASGMTSVDAQTLDTAALEKWLQRYGSAWETRDPALAAEIFAENALYQETPFEEPKRGRAGIREYWSIVTADQRDIDFDSVVVAVAGNTGVAHWSASFRLESTGTLVELDGVFLLEFDATGLCTSLREWWHVREP